MPAFFERATGTMAAAAVLLQPGFFALVPVTQPMRNCLVLPSVDVLLCPARLFHCLSIVPML